MKMYLLIVITLTISCRYKPILHDSAKDMSPVQSIVDSIAQYSNIVSDRSPHNENFEKLIKIATDSELIALTDHPKSNVKVYAFWALARRSYKGIKLVLEKKLNDTTSIEYTSGCVSNTDKVNAMCLKILTPDSSYFNYLIKQRYNNSNYLTLPEKEILQYANQLKLH
jgi:hypothetical protein